MSKRLTRLATLLVLTIAPVARPAVPPASAPAPSSGRAAAAPSNQTNGANTSNVSDPATSIATDPGYHLLPGDSIAVSVYGEDLSAVQILGRTGIVKLPLIGEVSLSGKTVREAEHAIEAIYREREFLKKPVVNIAVTNYFPREVSVLGAVRSPQVVGFDRDSMSMDIVSVIVKVGGFSPIAVEDEVYVMRPGPDGKEERIIVDMKNALSGRRKPGTNRVDFPIYPGDRIWVPESIF